MAVQGKDLEEIISGWNSELDTRSRAFVKHAEALAEWDRHILHSRHALLSLEEEVLQACLTCTLHRARALAPAVCRYIGRVWYTAWKVAGAVLCDAACVIMAPSRQMIRWP